MSKKATSIVSYITLIGWFIAFFAGDKEGAKFYLNQSLVYFIANAIVSILNFVLGGIFIVAIILSIVGIFLLVCWILGLVWAIQQKENELPLIGKIRILK